jgi:Fur family ferric uptake transcriptional regulator
MESRDLRKAGLKITVPRMRILELLEHAGGKHLTDGGDLPRAGDARRGHRAGHRVPRADPVRGRRPRDQAQLRGGHAVYELERGKHHDHMVDVESGKVVEFVSDEIERLQREIAARHGYALVDHSLVLYVRAEVQGIAAEGQGAAAESLGCGRLL